MRGRLSEFKHWPQFITVLLVASAFLGYRYFAFYNTRTDDAYISANVINMAPLVAGPISQIYVQENQTVKRGDKLIEIDPRPYRYALAKAEARLNIEKLHYENNKHAIEVAKDKLQQTQFILGLRQDFLKRYQKLQTKGYLAELALLDIEAKTHEQEASVLAALQELKIAQKNLDKNNILAAEAVLSQARYMNEHTTILAPQDGYITNFNLRIGQYVQVGEGLFALIETNRWWVVSRYRETAIRLIRPGDKAKITLSMYPEKTFHGHVESVGWGINRVQTGGVNSTLPYLAATEDWIKIAQRFPVRISIDDVSPEYPLRIGASAVTKTY
jgi:membrane fusion protein (multidrug efflux system)